MALVFRRGSFRIPADLRGRLHPEPQNPADEWMSARGVSQASASVDIHGGFPGFARQGGVLVEADLTLTDHYLLVNEGRANGFGLSLDRLVGVGIEADPSGSGHLLMLRYADSLSIRLFTVRFRSGPLLLRGAASAEDLAALLIGSDVMEADTDSVPDSNDYLVTWDRTGRYEQEAVRWSGSLTAPVGFGLEGGPAECWLTDRSIMWGMRGGGGIYHVPLRIFHDVITAEINGSDDLPVAYLGLGDPRVGRFDLGFTFDDPSMSGAAMKERAAFLMKLRNAGVPIGEPASAVKPWTINLATHVPPVAQRITTRVAPLLQREEDGPVDIGISATTIEVGATLLPGDPGPTDILLSEWAVPLVLDAEAWDHADPDGNDVTLNEEWTEELSEEWNSAGPAALEHGGEERQDHFLQEVTRSVDATAGSEIIAPRAIRSFESDAMAYLLSVMRSVDDRVAGARFAPIGVAAPSAERLADALSALLDLAADGVIEPMEARSRANRLRAITDAAARLRVAMDQRDAGRLTDADIVSRRDQVSASIADLIFPARTQQAG